MDESYIHGHYTRHDDSLYDPDDEQDLQVAVRFKGRRYCFIAAIIDADHRINPTVRQPHQQAHILQQTLDIFQGGKRQVKDYHDTAYLAAWMSKLLAALRGEHVGNAVIVMNNAIYHRALPEGTPQASWKKSDLLQACTRYAIPMVEEETKPMIWRKLRDYIQSSIAPVAVAMAREESHEVLFTPPHHSGLQPIETMWAIVKGVVGRQYTSSTTLKGVLKRLENAFADLTSPQVQGCIDKANEWLEDIYTHIKATEEVEGECGDDTCSEVEDVQTSDAEEAE